MTNNNDSSFNKNVVSERFSETNSSENRTSRRLSAKPPGRGFSFAL